MLISNIRKNNVVLTLLHFSMQWHGRVMKNIFVRYKILLLFLLLIVAPTLTSLLYIVTLPAKNLVASHVFWLSGILSLSLYQLLGLIWIAGHEAIFFNQSWDSYLRTLPITNKQKIFSEILVLILINTLIWLPLVFAGFAEIIKSTHSFLSIILVIQKIFLNVALVLLVQIFWQKKQIDVLFFLIWMDVLVILQSYHLKVSLQVGASCLLIAAVFLQLTSLAQQKVMLNWFNLPVNFYLKKIHKVGSYFVCSLMLAKMQTRNLLRTHYAQLFLPGTLLLVLDVFVILLGNHGENSISLKFIVGVGLLINGLILSNLFARFHEKRQEISVYFNSLSLKTMTLFIADMLLPVFLMLILNLLMLKMTIHLFTSSYLWAALVSFVVPFLFLSATYFPQIKFKRYGFFLSLVLMFLFAWAEYVLLSFIN